MFGGKQQRGWYLYKPLISALVGTNQPADTNEFAAAISRWQARQRLSPTGVLDEESIYAMVGHWQSLRIRDRSYPQPDQLVTGSLEDFYDQSRPEELRQVHRETYTAYKQMILAAKADPLVGPTLAGNAKYLKIISSFRSREYQEKLRRESPNAGRAGLAINSPHFTGRALDIYVGGEPVETKDSNRSIQIQTPVYLWLTRNAHRFGFRPYFYEPWHWEYVR
jgi:LAS superfamily LD-carboxypeptidase LdcB